MSELSIQQKVERVQRASDSGDPNTLSYLLHEGWLDTLPENEQRKLIADSLANNALIHDTNCSNGKYPDLAYTDQNMAEQVSVQSQTLRAKALDIRLNPEGKSLKDQFPWP